MSRNKLILCIRLFCVCKRLNDIDKIFLRSLSVIKKSCEKLSPISIPGERIRILPNVTVVLHTRSAFFSGIPTCEFKVTFCVSPRTDCKRLGKQVQFVSG